MGRFPGVDRRAAGMLLGIALSALAGCISKSPVPTDPASGGGGASGVPTVVGVDIIQRALTMRAGEQLRLDVNELLSNGTTRPATSGLGWTSSAAEVAEVNAEGVLVAKRAGSAVVRVTRLTFTDSVNVSVLSAR